MSAKNFSFKLWLEENAAPAPAPAPAPTSSTPSSTQTSDSGSTLSKDIAKVPTKVGCSTVSCCSKDFFRNWHYKKKRKKRKKK